MARPPHAYVVHPDLESHCSATGLVSTQRVPSCRSLPIPGVLAPQDLPPPSSPPQPVESTSSPPDSPSATYHRANSTTFTTPESRMQSSTAASTSRQEQRNVSRHRSITEPGSRATQVPSLSVLESPRLSVTTTTTATTTSPSTTSAFPVLPTPTSSPICPIPRSTTHKPTHLCQSRSRLNLGLDPDLQSNSQPQVQLRSKRSKLCLPQLLPPSTPPEIVLKSRAHNSDPGKVFVNRLPPELLRVIFLLLITPSSPSHLSSSSVPLLSPSNPPSSTASELGSKVAGNMGGGAMDTMKIPRIISQVCHFWRRVALNEPLLWARTLNLREGPKWIIEILRRSGECTIDIVGLRETSSVSSLSLSSMPLLRMTGSPGSRGGVGRGGSRSVLGVVLNELKRVGKLHLTIERREEWRLFVDVLVRSEAPALESLAVKSLVRRMTTVPGSKHGLHGGSGGHDFNFNSASDSGSGTGSDNDWLGGGVEDEIRLTKGMFKGIAPALKHLSLSMVGLSAVSPLPWLSSLTTLQITDLDDQNLMCIWSWLSILRQTPVLQSLILRNVFASETAPSSPSDSQNVVLKKLRSIEIKGTMMESCEFLDKLVVPGVCRLAMSLSRANNAHAAGVLGGWLRERKMRAEHMEEILRTPIEVSREIEWEKRRGRWLLVHPSASGLKIKVNEVLQGSEKEEEDGVCVVNLGLSFGSCDQSEERHRLAVEIFDILTRALQMVYEVKGGFDALNLSLFGVRDGIKVWRDELVQFLAWLDRVEELQEISGYTASVVFPLLAQSPQLYQHQRRLSTTSLTSVASSRSTERFRHNVLLPSLSRITLAFVEFAPNVDDEFEASCEVRAVPEFVKRRYGLVGGMSAGRQRAGSLKVRFECCSGPKSILDELRRLGVEYRLGWACDFDFEDN